jgi:hypothetical protein
VPLDRVASFRYGDCMATETPAPCFPYLFNAMLRSAPASVVAIADPIASDPLKFEIYHFELFFRNYNGEVWNTVARGLYSIFACGEDENKRISAGVHYVSYYLEQFFNSFNVNHCNCKRLFRANKEQVLKAVATEIVSTEFQEFEIGNSPL